MGVLDALREKWVAPTEPKESVEGQVVLVTGANTGLGLEVAKKIAALKPKKLIITTRSSSKGVTAKEQIEQWLSNNTIEQSAEITPLVLDMSSSDGVKAFVQKLFNTTNQLDAAILNAGINAPPFQISSDGYEETIQVNTVSTVFLASLLSPLLISTAKSKQTQTHLLFVSSRSSTGPEALPKNVSAQQLETPLTSFSEKANYPPGTLGGQIQYGRSKLFLEYAIRRLTQLPTLRDENGKPYVIINSVCPGVVGTEIARNYEGWLWGFVKNLLILVAGKPIPWGATIYLQALFQDDKTMGQLWIPERVHELWPALTTEEGRRLGDEVWKELKGRMISWDNRVSSLLS